MAMPVNTEIFHEIPDFKYDEEAIATNSEEFEKIVRSRRSTRVFTEEKIPEGVMRKCLELTLLAPNSSNLQPWEFYWVRNDRTKQELARFCLAQPAATTAQELVVCVARLDTWKRNRRMMLERIGEMTPRVPKLAATYYEKLVPLVYEQGPFYLFGPLKRLVFHILALFRPMPRGPAGKADMRVWAHKSTALACENLMLSLRAFGYDSCPMEGIDERRIQKLLHLPRTAEVCMVISAGKRAPKGIYGQQVRFDESLFVFEV